MKRFLAQFTALLAAVVMVTAAAMAEKKKDTVVLEKNTMVNGVLVKAGTYRAQFDFKTDLLSLMRQDGKVIATAPGKIEALPRKSEQTKIVTEAAGSDQVLQSITFSGDNRTIMIAGSEATPPAGAR
jgi:hypothetical protein